MKTKETILKQMLVDKICIDNSNEATLSRSDILQVMEEYGSQYRYAYENILEEKATDVSFHYADLEKETTEKLKDQISEMIYNAIPTGEVDAFTLIKVLKKLKSDVEAI